MNIKPGLESEYANYKQINQSSPYAAEVVRFGEMWADLMEKEIERGNTIANVAEPTCRTADNNGGITGYMYGCAVAALGKFWAHGEELRTWHNIKVQIGTEGEEANKSGGTLNPALINFDM